MARKGDEPWPKTAVSTATPDGLKKTHQKSER